MPECIATFYTHAGAIVAHRALTQAGIDARMMPESFVFESDDGPGELCGNTVGRRETPLTVSGDAGAQQASVAALQYRADRIVEQLARPQCEDQDEQCGNHPRKQQKILFISHRFFLYLQ